MIKAIFCDLDGTLLNEKGKISKETTDYLKKLNKQGVSIILISGRHKKEMNEYCDILQLSKVSNNFSVSCDGVYIYNSDGVLVNEPQYVNYDTISKVTKSIKYWSPISLITDNIDYTFITAKQIVKKIINIFMYQKTNYRSQKLIISAKKIKDVEKISVSSTHLKNILCKFENEDINYHINNSNVEILNPLSSKYNAAKYILKLLDITQEEALYFGDGDNDSQCLKYFENSYAMENASNDTKQYAHHLCESNSKNGVYKAIKERNDLYES